ncbi:uncharacterized protein LOC129574063 [Sitodiplosis mosellana]|uniref:uncharacterized protein LOC129574063 n=1 Tax=Sitodiplosis mosellana TaxID=263140 RepID=UPI00244523C3|nr:uncharacterized protein LOC129574063 [Sitodiplosis mosellana]
MSTAKKSTEPKAIDVNALVKAIKDCLIDKKQIKTTARSHDLPRSSLQRYLKKVEENYEDLSAVADDELTEFVRDCGQRFHHCPRKGTCRLHFALVCVPVFSRAKIAKLIWTTKKVMNNLKKVPFSIVIFAPEGFNN